MRKKYANKGGGWRAAREKKHFEQKKRERQFEHKKRRNPRLK